MGLAVRVIVCPYTVVSHFADRIVLEYYASAVFAEGFSLIVSGFPDLRAAELGEEATPVQSPVEWALSRLKEKGGRSVAPNEVRSYWTKRFFAPDYGSIYDVTGLELTGGESFALIERCSASPEQLMPEAEAGNAQAQYQLGQIYEKGLVMEEKAPEQAVQWYRMAAEQGHEGAQQALRRIEEAAAHSDAKTNP